MCLIQGEQGSQGVTGPRGLPGEGFPGAKVSLSGTFGSVCMCVCVSTYRVLTTDVVPHNA